MRILLFLLGTCNTFLIIELLLLSLLIFVPPYFPLDISNRSNDNITYLIYSIFFSATLAFNFNLFIWTIYIHIYRHTPSNTQYKIKITFYFVQIKETKTDNLTKTYVTCNYMIH